MSEASSSLLSHSAKNEAVMRPDGLRHSRVLELRISAQGLGSDWAHLEACRFRLRDRLNQGRRFLPLRLDGTPIKGSNSRM